MKLCLLLVMLAGNSLGIGCQKMTDSAVTDSYCRVSEPVRWSRRDTPGTIALAKYIADQQMF